MSKLQITSYRELFGTLRETKEAFERFVVEVKPIYAPHHDFRVHKLATDKTVASRDLDYEVWFCTSITEATAHFHIDEDSGKGTCSLLLPMTNREHIRKALDQSATLSICVDNQAEQTIHIISDLDLLLHLDKAEAFKEIVDSGKYNSKRGCSFCLEFPTVTM